MRDKPTPTVRCQECDCDASKMQRNEMCLMHGKWRKIWTASNNEKHAFILTRSARTSYMLLRMVLHFTETKVVSHVSHNKYQMVSVMSTSTTVCSQNATKTETIVSDGGIHLVADLLHVQPIWESSVDVVQTTRCQIGRRAVVNISPVNDISIHSSISVSAKTSTAVGVLVSCWRWWWQRARGSATDRYKSSARRTRVKSVVVPQKPTVPDNPDAARQAQLVRRVGRVLPARTFIGSQDGIGDTETVAADDSLDAVASSQHAKAPFQVSTIRHHAGDFLLQLLQTRNGRTRCQQLGFIWSFDVQVAEEQRVVQTDTAATRTGFHVYRVVPGQSVSNNRRHVNVFIGTVVFRQTHAFRFVAAYHLRSRCRISVFWCTVVETGTLWRQISGIWKQDGVMTFRTKCLFNARGTFIGWSGAFKATFMTDASKVRHITCGLCADSITLWRNRLDTTKI